jgi:glycosyltransferase involved in cell wall biosynthesis
VTSSPAISVLMPVRNAAATLPAALESILNQTFGDFELLAIDDASSDGSGDLLREYAARDARLSLHCNSNRQGVSLSLNDAIERARGRFIARMDADDLSTPDRFARQIAFLEAHLEIGVLGTQARVIDADGSPLPRWTPVLPVEHDLLAWRLLETTPLVHPSVMIRRELFDSGARYDESIERGQDMELWTRLVASTRFANTSETLLDYRVEESTYSRKLREMSPLIQRTAQRYSERILGRPVEFRLLQVHFDYHHRVRDRRATPDELISTSLLLAELYEAMSEQGILMDGANGPARPLMEFQVQALVSAATA